MTTLANALNSILDYVMKDSDSLPDGVEFFGMCNETPQFNVHMLTEDLVCVTFDKAGEAVLLYDDNTLLISDTAVSLVNDDGTVIGTFDDEGEFTEVEEGEGKAAA